MLLIKTSLGTLETVLQEAKHASVGIPNDINAGDIILVSQTKNTLLPAQKSIRWIMSYVRTYYDIDNETDALWGRHWPYIIECENVRSIEPFHIEELQKSNKNYQQAQKFAQIEPEDEAAILQWIDEEANVNRDERDNILEEFKQDYNNLIERLDAKYSGTPEYTQRIVRQVKRPSALREAILARDGATCKICKTTGFLMKNGKPYAETHHMIELSKEAPNSLQSWNVLVVCPTCHKKLHYAQVETEFLNPGWRIRINGQAYTLM